MLILGLVLALIGWIVGLGVLVTIGIIIAVVGLILLLVGAAGTSLGGRRYWY